MPLYFIALIPDPVLREKIRSIKEEIKEKYAAKHALKLPAHITLQIPFKMESEKEKELIKILTDFAEEQKAFKVALSDFGAFPPRVLYIEIKDHQPIKELHQKLKVVMNKQFNLQEREKNNEIHPHITVATRDLSKTGFQSAWSEYKDKKFQDNFMVSSLSLLKHNSKKWDVLQEFFFEK